jgi:hypothetical protein
VLDALALWIDGVIAGPAGQQARPAIGS